MSVESYVRGRSSRPAIMPRGAAVKRFRVSERELVVADDGSVSEATRTVSGGGILVSVRPDSQSRRTFTRFCARNGIIVKPIGGAVYADGTFNRRTGEQQRSGEAIHTEYQCVGEGSALLALTKCPAVDSWCQAVSVRVPVICGGSGTSSMAGEKRIREGKREGCERAAERERGTLRVERGVDRDIAQLRQAADALGIRHDDTVRMPWLGELIRLVAEGQGDSQRAVTLRGELGL